MDGPNDPARSIPEPWRDDVQRQLQVGENLLAWFEPDLKINASVYAKRLVVLTDRRVLGYGEMETPADRLAPAGSDGPSWQAWPLDESQVVECRDRGGAGSLEVVTPSRRLCHWRRYTPIVATAA